MPGIYAIRCNINEKVYIGQTSGKFNGRFNAHRCDLRKGKGIQKLQIDWNLYGEDNFDFIIIEFIEDKKARNLKEKEYIQLFDSINNGYNTAPGGIGQGNFNYLNGMFGKHHSLASKQLMSINRKGLATGRRNGNYGVHDTSKFTESVRQRMSEKQKARWERWRIEHGRKTKGDK